MRREIEKDPAGVDYRDISMTSASEDDALELEMFTVTQAARDAVAKFRRRAALR